MSLDAYVPARMDSRRPALRMIAAEGLAVRSSAGQSWLRFARPWDLLLNLVRHHALVRQFTWREIRARYQGSYLGLLWSFLLPLAMILAYTFVFRYVLNARWGVSPDESAFEFGLTLFTGLLMFNLFGESVSRAPAMIVGHPNFVKKVIFPLEILPVTSVAASLVHVGVSLVVLVGVAVGVTGSPGWHALWLPVILLPYVCFILGVTWFLSSLGVFLRDLGPLTAVAVQLLVFLSPVFYPLTAVPEPWRTVMQMNPMAAFVDSARRVLLWDQPPNWRGLAVAAVLSFVVMQAGYAWFMKSKRAFADVM